MSHAHNTPAENAATARDTLRQKAIAQGKKKRHANSAFLHMCAEFADTVRQQKEKEQDEQL